MSILIYAVTFLIKLLDHLEGRFLTSWYQPQDVSLVVFLSLAVGLYLYKLFQRKHYELDRRHRFEFDVLFELHIRYAFIKQTKETLVCLKNAARCIVGPQAKHPSVVLLMATEPRKETALCLGSRLLRVCSAALGEPKTTDYVRSHIMVDGAHYGGVSDFWDFYHVIKQKLKYYKMVLVKDIQAVHPHAVTILSTLAHEVFCPYEQALIVLVMETSNVLVPPSFGTSPSLLAEWWVEQTFGPSLDNATMSDLKRTLTARAVVVAQEDHKPVD